MTGVREGGWANSETLSVMVLLHSEADLPAEAFEAINSLASSASVDEQAAEAGLALRAVVQGHWNDDARTGIRWAAVRDEYYFDQVAWSQLGEHCLLRVVAEGQL